MRSAVMLAAAHPAARAPSLAVVLLWLAIMRDHGLIIASGDGKAARYYLPEHAPDIDEAEDTPADDDAA